jgi:hypothetical protein
LLESDAVPLLLLLIGNAVLLLLLISNVVLLSLEAGGRAGGERGGHLPMTNKFEYAARVGQLSVRGHEPQRPPETTECRKRVVFHYCSILQRFVKCRSQNSASVSCVFAFVNRDLTRIALALALRQRLMRSFIDIMASLSYKESLIRASIASHSSCVCPPLARTTA